MTVEVAKAAFPKGNALMKIRDELGPLFEDHESTKLYPDIGQPSVSPAGLTLVTILQFMENLTAREAADAVRSRIDWKYLLALELTDAGFHYSVLSEFRQRLLEHGAEEMLLNRILEQCVAAGLLKGQSKQRTDSTRVLAKIRSLNRVELAGETMRRVLDDIAQIAPIWLQTHIKGDWGTRYGYSYRHTRYSKKQSQTGEVGANHWGRWTLSLGRYLSRRYPEKDTFSVYS